MTLEFRQRNREEIDVFRKNEEWVGRIFWEFGEYLYVMVDSHLSYELKQVVTFMEKLNEN